MNQCWAPARLSLVFFWEFFLLAAKVVIIPRKDLAKSGYKPDMK
jgi:hypothetical protein